MTYRKGSKMHKHDTAYWEKYYKFWDDFVGAWFTSMQSQKDRNIAERIAMQFGNASSINLDELPEPYYGKPHEDVDAVFINLNPGMSTEDGLESTKFFSKLIVPYPEGWLIKKFAKTKSYRDYANGCSCLDPNLRAHNPEVCGVKWWQDLAPKPIGGRMSWVRRIYNNANMCPSKVFALELCPFHSKRWEFDLTENRSLKDFINEHVIEPAVIATIENGLPFAIAVGASIRDVLAHAGATKEREWVCEGKNRQRKLSEDVLDIWPQWEDGRLIVRCYRLYRIQREGKFARILVTWAAGGNTCPQEGFNGVEQRIRQYVYDNSVGGVVCSTDDCACDMVEVPIAKEASTNL